MVQPCTTYNTMTPMATPQNKPAKITGDPSQSFTQLRPFLRVASVWTPLLTHHPPVRLAEVVKVDKEGNSTPWPPFSRTTCEATSHQPVGGPKMGGGVGFKSSIKTGPSMSQYQAGSKSPLLSLSIHVWCQL